MGVHRLEDRINRLWPSHRQVGTLNRRALSLTSRSCACRSARRTSDNWWDDVPRALNHERAAGRLGLIHPTTTRRSVGEVVRRPRLGRGPSRPARRGRTGHRLAKALLPEGVAGVASFQAAIDHAGTGGRWNHLAGVVNQPALPMRSLGRRSRPTKLELHEPEYSSHGANAVMAERRPGGPAAGTVNGVPQARNARRNARGDVRDDRLVREVQPVVRGRP